MTRTSPLFVDTYNEFLWDNKYEGHAGTPTVLLISIETPTDTEAK